MPFIINLGVSRKASKDFKSTGYSLNLTAELDSGLLADTNRLQIEILDGNSLSQRRATRQIHCEATISFDHSNCAMLKCRHLASMWRIGGLRSRGGAATFSIADPMPDQSWMDTPLPQEKFFGWM